jgi:hypothetical protein
VVGGLYALLLFSLFAIAHHDPRDFIELGRRYIERSQVSQAIRVDPSYPNYLVGDGYDGQFSYYIALDPLNARYYIDAPVYRYERIGYPLFAWLLAAGQAPLIPYSMIAVNWLAATLGTLAAAARLRASGFSGWWATVFGLAPGMYFALRRDLTDALAYALVALAILPFYRGGSSRFPWSAIVFALAVLTRETTAVFAVIFALSWLWSPSPLRGGPGRGSQGGLPLWGRAGWGLLYLIIALGPWLLFRLFLVIWLHGLGSTTPFEPLPFLGILYYWPWSLRIRFEVLSIVLPALLVAVIATTALFRRQITPLTVALLANVLLFVVFLNEASFVELAASARISLAVILPAILAIPTLDRLGRWRYLGLALAAVLWLAPLPLVAFPPLGRALGMT